MFFRLGILATSLLTACLLLLESEAQQPDEALAQAAGVEVLARGPLHEAYATPVQIQEQPSALIPQAPPDPINELPPEQKPDGEVVIWIPGYWNWNDADDQYVWVSGFWRVPPDGMEWVPGYWQQAEEGWQRASGFWRPIVVEEVTYVPAPPPSIDAGPSQPPAVANAVYIPGNWIYRETRFLWRPGFWTDIRPGWVWVPARYCWSPAGYVFIDGYWDRPLLARGLLFAPIRIQRIPAQPWIYVPTYVVRRDFLVGALFVGPSRERYYFGDFFADADERRGYVPWVNYRYARLGHDPNYIYYRATGDGDRWGQTVHALYEGRRAGAIARPPRTLVQQQEFVQNITVNQKTKVDVTQNINITNIQNVTALTPINRLEQTAPSSLITTTGAERERQPIKLRNVPQAERSQEEKLATQNREAAQQRRQTENQIFTKKEAPLKATDPSKAARIMVPGRERPRNVNTVVKAPPLPEQPKAQEAPVPKYEPPRPTQPPRASQQKEKVQVPVPAPGTKTAPKEIILPKQKIEDQPMPKKNDQPMPKKEDRPLPKPADQTPPKKEEPPKKIEKSPIPRPQDRPVKDERPPQKIEPKPDAKPVPKKEDRPAQKIEDRPMPKPEAKPAPKDRPIQKIEDKPKTQERPPAKDIRPPEKSEQRPAPKTQPAPKKDEKPSGKGAPKKDSKDKKEDKSDGK